MAGSISLKNRGPSPFEFTHKGKSVAIPSGGVAGPFDSTVLQNNDVYARLTSGGLISFGDAGPTAEIAIATPNHIVQVSKAEVPDVEENPNSTPDFAPAKKKKHRNE